MNTLWCLSYVTFLYVCFTVVTREAQHTGTIVVKVTVLAAVISWIIIDY